MTRIPTDPEQIRQLAAVMVENGLTEVEISDKDTKVRVVRGGMSGTGMTQASSVTHAPAVEAVSRPLPASVPENAAQPGAVTSPMVGVVYLAPEPGAANFVNIGQQVTVGQTLCLIEAMKTFNQIKAAHAGTVTKVVVQNSSPVEYGELLMVVE